MTVEQTHHVLRAPTMHFNLSPVGFRRWARHFLACRDTFASPDPGFSPVPYFLNCRAIELELKARLLETAKQKEVKDKYGHDLERSYANLPVDQQTLTHAEVDVLKAASAVYKGKGFEYFGVVDAMTGYERFPDLAALDDLTIKLVIGSQRTPPEVES